MTRLLPLFSRLMIFILTFAISGCALFSREVDNIEVAPSPNVVNRVALTKEWSNGVRGNTKIYSLLGPASDDQMVYLASRDGEIKAVARQTGKTRWNTNVSKNSFFHSNSALLSGGVSVDIQYVYVGSEKAVVYALDRNIGKVIWQKDVAGEVLTKPISSGNRVLIHTSNGYLQALNKKTGALIWETNLDVPPLSLRGQSTPAVVDGMVIIGDDNGHVNAISLKDGLLIWQQRISQPGGSTEIARLDDVDVTPVIINNVIYAVGYNGNMVGLDLHTGQLLWHRNMGSTHNFLVTSQCIYIVDQNDVLKALDRNDGSLMWQNEKLKNRRLTDPVLYDRYMAVGDSEGYLYLVDPSEGKFVYKTFISGSGLLSAPIVIDNKLIIQARNGTTQAYVLSKG